MSKIGSLIEKLRTKVKRLSLSMAGTLGIAGSNFLMSLVLIPALQPTEYGFFTFGQILTQFSYSIINAMGGTPLSITLNRGGDDWQARYMAIMKVDFMLAVVAGLAALGSGIFFSMPLPVVCLMGCFTFFAALRWGYRCAEFARHRLHTVAVSDVIYAVAMVGGAATVKLMPSIDTLLVASAAAASAAALSWLYLFIVAERVKLEGIKSRLSDYIGVWKEQSRWALLGVITTEMTANGHSYLVTFMAGPHAFAPIAIATLFWRPLTVVLPALMLVERPVMAKQLGQGNLEAARTTSRGFLRIVFSILAGNILLVLGCAYFLHDKIKNLPYEPSTLYLACSLWFVVILLQSIRVPAGTLVQAATRFRELAKTSLVAAPVTMMIAALIIYFSNPVASIVGIIAGEIVMTSLVFRLTRKDDLLLGTK